MARARNIKPGFFTNDVLADVEPLGRILFQGLWCHADREGRLECRPRKLKAEILPYDDCDVEDLLSQLEVRGFIIRYEVENNQYIQVVNFTKHQNPHIKEGASSIPAQNETVQALSEHSTSTVQEQCSNGESTERAVLIPDSLNLIPDTKVKALSAKADSVAVFDYWKQVMDSPKSNLDRKRKAAIEARLRDGFSVEDLKAAINGCRKTPHNMGDNDRGQKFNDIELICRNAPNVERFMNATGASPPKPKAERPLTAAEKYAAQRDAMRANHERTITGTATRIA